MQLYTRLNRSGRSHADPSAAASGDGAVFSVSGDPDRPTVRSLFKFDVGQQFGFDEPDEIVVDGVELEAAVITHGKTGAIDYSPGTDENADRHRNLFFVNQVIEYDRRIELHAVQIEKQAGGLSRIVLSRHIDPIFALGAGINLRIVEREMQYFALRNAGLYLRVGIGRIAQVRLILRQRKTMRHDQRQRGQNESFHHIRLS